MDLLVHFHGDPATYWANEKYASLNAIGVLKLVDENKVELLPDALQHAAVVEQRQGPDQQVVEVDHPPSALLHIEAIEEP